MSNTKEHKGTNKSLGSNLKELRGKRLLREVCPKLNIDPATLSRIENDNRIPDVITAKRIADFYNVSLDKLLYDKDNESEDIPSKHNDKMMIVHNITGLSMKSINRISDKSDDKQYMKMLNYYIESGKIDSIIYALSALETISKPVLNINKSPNYIKHFHEDKTIDILDNALKILSSIVDEIDASVIHKGAPSELEKYTQFLKEACLNENQEDLEHDDLD